MVSDLLGWLIVASCFSCGWDVFTYEDRLKKWESERQSADRRG